jgi:hypothetical protein
MEYRFRGSRSQEDLDNQSDIAAYSRRGPNMQCVSERASILIIVLVAAMTSGCTLHGAPSFVLFGAFFPAWMLLAFIGILAAIGTRITLVATGLAELLPLQLAVCVSAGVMVAILAWLLWFAR